MNMQLGTILDGDGGEPIVGRTVEFRISKKSKARRFLIKAQLLPVSEADRQQSKRDALHYLRTAPHSPYRDRDDAPGESIPADVLEEERTYKFLQAALHTTQDARVRLVATDDYEAFRQGVVAEQVIWLNGEYKKLIEQEYPEVISKTEKEALVEQATGK